MKIVCENCGAKYSIADEKVKGKVFKIRCKKCNESIVVRGDANQAAIEPDLAVQTPAPHSHGADEDLDAETRVFDYGGYNHGAETEAVWHIVVDDQQQGPYTTAQILEYLASGSVSSDSLIWREGFDDWMVISDVQDFAQARPAFSAGATPVGGGGLFDEQPGAKAASKLFDDQPSSGGLFSAIDAGGGSPFDTGGGLFSNSGAGISGDVFSSAAPEPAGGGLFGDGGKSSNLFKKKEEEAGDEGIFSSTREPAPSAHAASPRVSAAQAMMTGQRNENSVLFSLSNLQALAAGPTKDKDPIKAAGARPMSGFAASPGGEEASGLIDIRALAGSLSTSEQNNSVDDFISMGGGGFSPALGAPVLAAQHEGMSNTVKIAIVGGAVLFLAVIVIGLVVALSKDDEAQSAAQAQILALQKQIEDLSTKGNSAENAEALALLKEKLKAETAAQSKGESGSSSAGTAEKEDDSKKSGSPAGSSSSGGKRKPGKGGSSSSETGDESSSSSSSSESTATTTTPSKPPSRTSELDDLLGGPSKPAKPAKPAGESSGGSSLGPAPKASLSREDVQQGMAAVAPAVQSCGQGKGGTITMNMSIGKTGRVSSASATGAFAGTPIGDCAARAVRRAKFPASQQNLNVKYPFKL